MGFRGTDAQHERMDRNDPEPVGTEHPSRKGPGWDSMNKLAQSDGKEHHTPRWGEQGSTKHITQNATGHRPGMQAAAQEWRRA